MFKKVFQKKYIFTFGLAILAAVSLAACGKSDSITGITWQWSSMTETSPASQTVVPNPENYTLLLNTDGTFSMKNDCNMVAGSYTLDGSELSLMAGPSTMAFCGEQSLDQTYLKAIAQVTSYSLEDGDLVLALQDGAGTMTFKAP